MRRSPGNREGKPEMEPRREIELMLTRRQLFGLASRGVGIGALASLLSHDLRAAAPSPQAARTDAGLPGLPHFAPTAKRVIYLHQSGGPSQIDLFDYKPVLARFQGSELPASVRMGQR